METTPRSREGRPVRQPVLLGLFTGVAVGVGYLLAGVPGVELMTLVAALAGLTLGARAGAAAGALAALVYSLGSPYGLPLPPVLAAQVLGMAAAGALGAPLGRVQARRGAPWRLRVFVAGATGVLAALVFDVLTNLATALATDLSLAAVAAMAASMFLIHATSSAAAFALVVPAAAPRLALLGGGGGLVGRGTTLALAGIVLAGVPAPVRAQAAPPAAPADTTAAAVADTAAGPTAPARVLVTGGARPSPGPRRELCWQRPLWIPFAPSLPARLQWYSPRTVAAEAVVGAPTVVLGEAATSALPRVEVDGVPWNLGHAVADDPWLLPDEGLVTAEDAWFDPVAGDPAGVLRLRTADPTPDRAISGYRGTKGPHESYARSVHLLTPRARWRAGFFFSEIMDQEAYNYTDLPDPFFGDSREGFRGHGRIRQSRTRLERHAGDAGLLRLDFSTGRKTKDDLPAWRAEHGEVWDRGVAATWRGAGGGVGWRAVMHWRDRDVQWGDKPVPVDGLVPNRKLEVHREGVVLDLWRAAAPARAAAPDSADTTAAAVPAVPARDPASWRRRGADLRLELGAWTVADSGDTLRTLPALPGPVDGTGEEARATAAVGGGLAGGRWRLSAGGAWARQGGVAPVASFTAGEDAPRPRWQLTLAGDGRMPRSDELLTPLVRSGGVSGAVTILPNPYLQRETTLRAGLVLRARLLGNELALDAAARRLRDGITWVAATDDPDLGRWRNALDLDSTRLTASVSREGRLLGWARAMLEGTWQTFDVQAGHAALLPPQRSLRMHLFWENHFFQEDGILQLGLITTVRGEMADPWDVSGATGLPRRTVHDLLVGFRLVGVHLSLAIRNLTGDRTQLSRTTFSPGQETDLRLHWNFRY